MKLKNYVFVKSLVKPMYVLTCRLYYDHIMGIFKYTLLIPILGGKVKSNEINFKHTIHYNYMLWL